MYRSSSLIAVGVLALLGLGQQRADEPLTFDGLGPHTRKVSTSSPEAQRFFDQGLNFLFAFNHSESIKSFEAASKADPNCGMAWWGIATASGPHINNMAVSPEEEKTAFEALQKAKAATNLTQVEKDLIEAATHRYADPQPEDRTALNQAYADAMRKVWEKHPNDADVGALFAEAMMDLRPWDLWTRDGKPHPGTTEVTDTLGKVLDMNSMHPLALHLAIHAWEASSTPEKAEKAADNLRMLQPGLGHMVHMPSHIDVRLGKWEESIAANERAIAADEGYRKKRPMIGFYRLYMTHNRHMLGFSAMMCGQSAKAIEAMDAMVASIPDEWVEQHAPMIDGYMPMPLEARIRFGKWDDILKMPAYPEYLPIANTIRHMARGVAYAAKGEVDSAKAERELFTQSMKKVKPGSGVGNSDANIVMELATNMLDGEIYLAEGKMDQAVASLRKAVEAEDQLTYNEPPDWVIPTRHVLGVALLKAGKPDEAEAVYRKDLEILPNNGWSLQGLYQALSMQGKEDEAKIAKERFTLHWKNADTKIATSCMCVPEI